MTAALLALWLLLHPPSLTEKDAQEVYRNLSKYTGYSSSWGYPLVIVDSPIINAYADKDKIVLYTGFLRYFHDKDELAAVLGHEMAHILLEHVSVKHKFEQSILEANADKLGIYLVMRAGYNVCGGYNIWKRMLDEQGDGAYGSSHPNYSYRLWEFAFNSCIGVK